MTADQDPNRRDPAGVWVAVQTFRLVMRLAHPAAHRRRFGEETVSWFRRRIRSKASTSARVGYLAVSLVDLVKTGVSLRLRARSNGSRLASWFDDARGAARALSRRPVFAALVVLVLAVPLAANTAIYGVANAALLRPLPYPQPNELVVVWARQFEANLDRGRLSGPELRHLWDNASSFEALGGLWARFGTLDGSTAPQHVDVGYVAGSFFSALGVSAERGRLIGPEDEVGGVRSAIVLTHDLWVRTFGSDSEIIGRRLEFNGAPVTVVGVLPEDFRTLLPREARLSSSPDVFLPWAGTYAEMPVDWRFFAAVARLKPGATVVEANQELASLAPQLSDRLPAYANAPLEFVVEPLHQEVTAPLRAGVSVLFASGVLLLLVACANVSLLLLSRTLRRNHEFAVREALGAARGRITRQVTLEHLALFVAAGAIGSLLAWPGLMVLARVVPDEVRLVHTPTLEPGVLVGTFATVAAVGLVFGALPATRIRGGMSRSLVTTRGATGGRDVMALRGAVLAGETALCIMLLIGSGLLLRSFQALNQVDLGFRPAGVVAANLSLPSAEYPYDAPEEISSYYEELLRRLRAAPEIVDAAVTEQLPLLAGSADAEPYSWIGSEGETEWGPTRAHVRSVSAGYLPMIGAQLIEGRWFDRRDELGAELAVIVDDRLAARAWPGRSGVGERIRVPVFLHERSEPHWARVIGVVRHVQLTSPEEVGPDQVWMHHAQSPRRTVSIVLNGRSDDEYPVDVLRRVVSAHDPGRPAYDVRTVDTIRDRTMAPTRLLLGLTLAFSILAALLAALGLYALVSRTVSAARREVGIRLALGGHPTRVGLGLVQSLARYVAYGVGAGLAGGLAVAAVVSSSLFGIASDDVLTVASLVLAVTLVAVSSILATAFRAVRIRPREALTG